MAHKRNTLGCLFYIALVLLALVIFLFNRSRVQEVIEKTGFTRLFERKKPAPVEVVVEPPVRTDNGARTGNGAPAGNEAARERQSQPEPSAPKAAPQEEVVVSVDKAPQQPRQPGSGSTAQPAKPAAKTRQARLFFIAVDPGGNIQLKGVIRPVEYVDAPLTSTLQALLKGPTPTEVNQGLISLISPETRLRRVYVKQDTAYLDFSEAFRFNSLGKEGLAAQLKQVVYSATEFPTVKQVQILIDGKTASYLSPEGLYIGKPLARSSFAR
jgi:spore germination protein GerM